MRERISWNEREVRLSAQRRGWPVTVAGPLAVGLHERQLADDLARPDRVDQLALLVDSAVPSSMKIASYP